MKRKSLSPMRRLALFEKAQGVCHICEQRIQAGQKWEVEHVRALGLLGKDDESNWKPAHATCHAGKTAADVARISKAKRQAARHIGIKKGRGLLRASGMKFDWALGRYVKEPR